MIALLGAGVLAVAHATGVAPIDVVHYAVRLAPDLANGGLHGQEQVELRLLGAGDAVALDAGTLQVDAVTWHGQALPVHRDGRRIEVALPAAQRAGARIRLDIAYHGAPEYGLEWHPGERQLYTIFSTSQWMPANDAPDDRATLDLTVALPAGIEAVGTGAAARSRTRDDGTIEHRWRLRTPMPSYLYGFAAGPFDRSETRRNGIDLVLLDAALTVPQRRRWLDETAAMLAFFADRAGVRYPMTAYAQALVVDTAGQEAAGMTLLSAAHAQAVLAGEDDTGLMAHEAAHTWWGNGVTNRAWTEFWLNEGMATFMAAAWLEQRDGRAAYDKAVARWEGRLQRLRNEGKDKPLVFPAWNRPTGDDRAVVYQKGAYVIHLLRERLGEAAFWRGIRAYTRGHMGRSVTTADLRHAMEQASGQDLGAFFAEWAGDAAVAH